jgi:MFS family permease
VLFGLVAHTESLAQTGQVAGWVLLGGLLGRGMGLFIPNLPGRRAAVAGTIGGLLGAMAFVAVSPSAGGLAGRFVGAFILGLLIGLMIALVEQWTREAWLEVRYGPRETRTVSLGAQPVSVGSAAGCTIYAAGAPPVAARYTLTGGQVRYEDVAAGQSRPVRPGARQQVGALTLTVCGAAPAPAAVSTAAPPARELVLRLSSGQTLPLRVGGRLSVQELRGLEAPAGDGVGAEVVRHPEEPGVLGLKNLSQRPWVATGAQGGRRPVEPGRSVRLAAGTRIDFGALEGEVQ